MNKIVNNFLLTGDMFMSRLHLRQPRFTYSAYGPFTKHRDRIRKFREIGSLKYLYRNELDKACFVRDAAYSDSKDLAKRNILDNILKDKAHWISINPKYDGYHRGLVSMVYKCFGEKGRSGEQRQAKQEEKSMKSYLENHRNQWLKNLKGGKCMQGLKIVFEQQI